MPEERVQRRLAAILAADVVGGYSRMVEADEAGTIARLKTVRTELLEPMLASDGGRVLKVMGDGVLIEFASAVDAVRNGLAIQDAMGRRNADLTEADRITLRVGINVGDVIIDDDDIHGDGVNNLYIYCGLTTSRTQYPGVTRWYQCPNQRWPRNHARPG